MIISLTLKCQIIEPQNKITVEFIITQNKDIVKML